MPKTYECQLHGATKARGRRFIFRGPAVIGQASQREVGFGFVDGGGGGHICDLEYSRQV